MQGMRWFEQMTYQQKIRWRLRVLWLIIVLMLAYMVVIGETGGGDSRVMTDLATRVSRIIFFGGLVWVICRIVHNRRLLKDEALRRENMLLELDERNRYLHDKSGGIVWDILAVCLLFITLTASLYNMAAFYTAAVILVLAAASKAGAYYFFSRR